MKRLHNRMNEKGANGLPASIHTPPLHRFSSRASRAKSQLLHSGQQVWMMDKFIVEDKVEMLEPFDLSVYVVVKQLAGRQLYCHAYCVKGKMQLGRQSTKATLAFLNITFLSLTNELGSTAESKTTVLTGRWQWELSDVLEEVKGPLWFNALHTGSEDTLWLTPVSFVTQVKYRILRSTHYGLAAGITTKDLNIANIVSR
ncbi:hypothetical protein Tco_1172703 [Tanacetum coccineum]